LYFITKGIGSNGQDEIEGLLYHRAPWQAKCTWVVVRMPLERNQSARCPANCSTMAITRYGSADITPVFSSSNFRVSAYKTVCKHNYHLTPYVMCILL
jgi:hypothetical protein